MPLGADDGQRLAAGSLVEPAQHELGADGAQLFGARPEGFVGGHQLPREGLRIRPMNGQIRVGELLGERELDVRLADETESNRGFAEPELVLALVLEDRLDVLGLELPALDEDRADGRRRPRS
jgi:hypothetical protein